MMRPFKLKPCFKDYIWGGTKLKLNYGKQTELKVVAESWELSAHEDGSSVICECFDDDLRDMAFFEYIKKYPAAAGKKAKGKFPIIIKLIDAKDNLSIQVHPDDEYALKHENSLGKTEMWYVLECDEGAFIYMGFNRNLTAEEFTHLISENSILEALNKVYVKKGDVFFIEAGTIHAITKGIVIAEIQQSSNITYRAYDYERVGADGMRRPLHVDKAAQVTKLTKYENSIKSSALDIENNNYKIKLLVQCDYFRVNSVNLYGTFEHTISEDSFIYILVTDGFINLEYYNSDVINAGNDNCALCAKKGEGIFVPASNSCVRITGEGCFLLIEL